MNKYHIPIYQPDLSGNVKKYVNECIDTTWISSKGRFVSEFEGQFSSFVGAEHGISVCNGTVALHLALVALGLGSGDEVIVPTLTYIASVNAITYTGAKPVFVDSIRDTWQMDPADILLKITPKTKAILAVHLYGQACDLDSILEISNKHNLYLIEDCAEAFGSLYKGRHVGTFGDVSTFSFFGNKTITTGEGGMVVTKNKTLSERARHYKGQGLASDREYWHDVIGYNYRLTNIAAAIGLAQLERADEIINKKRALAEYYAKLLEDLPVEMHAEQVDTKHSYWMISILVSHAKYRDPLRSHLAADGIETRPVFYPVHTMPMYDTKFRQHPIAEDIAWRGLNLPSWPGLTNSNIEHIANSIRTYFANGS